MAYMEGGSEFRAWNELPLDVLGHIFRKLKLRQVVQVISMVCKSWGKYLEEPDCWQKIDVNDWGWPSKDNTIQYDCRLRWLITRSSGCLREPSVLYVNDDQMSFIAEHVSASLRKLSLPCCVISDSIAEQVSKLSGLTTLDLNHCIEISDQGMESIGQNCQKLVSLTWVTRVNNPPEDNVVEALVQSMPNLKHLCLDHFILKTSVTLEMLSGFPELETFDIRNCWCSTDVSFLIEKCPNVMVFVPQRDDCKDDGMVVFAQPSDDFGHNRRGCFFRTVPFWEYDCEGIVSFNQRCNY